LGGSNIFASSESSGFSDGTGGVVNDIYVGTRVNVVVDPSTPQDTEEVDENEIIEEVLGAAVVRLPATGMSVTWAQIVFALLLLGGSMLITGLFLKKRKLAKTTVTTMLLVFGLMLVPFKVYADSPTEDSDIVVKMEIPASQVNDEFEITYVTSDLGGRSLEALCLVKKPGEGSFSQFDSDNFPGSGGITNGTSTCDVNSGVLTKQGTYTFKVKVEADGGSSYMESNDEDVTLDNEGPERPKYIKKDKKGSCKYEITVKAHQDGDTAYLEIYRDDDMKIQANDGSRIKTINMGPGDKEEFDDELYGSECGRTYYYATRAFDAAGNPSDLRVEEVDVTKKKEIEGETTYETEQDTFGAFVSGDSQVGVPGDEDGDGIPDDEQGGEGDGDILGEDVEVITEEGGGEGDGGIFNQWWFWVLILLGAGYLGKKVMDKRSETPSE
jgi:hypothetical protein